MPYPQPAKRAAPRTPSLTGAAVGSSPMGTTRATPRRVPCAVIVMTESAPGRWGIVVELDYWVN